MTTEPGRPTGTRLTDDWGATSGEVSPGLVFDCLIETETRRGSLAVYRDRLELLETDARVPTVVELERITAWRVRDEPPDVVVEVADGARRRARLPLAYAGAIRVALRDALGTRAER